MDRVSKQNADLFAELARVKAAHAIADTRSQGTCDPKQTLDGNNVEQDAEEEPPLQQVSRTVVSSIQPRGV